MIARNRLVAAAAAAVYAVVVSPLILGAALALAVRAGWVVIEEERAPRDLPPADPSGVRDGR